MQYPHPTPKELSNLTAFFDLVHSRGIKIILQLQNTHMDGPAAQNEQWIGSILKTIKNNPAFYLVDFGGDAHLYHGGGKTQCGGIAEPALWLGIQSLQAQYVKWAINVGHSLGVPYSKLSAEAVVGEADVYLSKHLSNPIAVMKQIYDSFHVPDSDRTYALSWYEHRKCRGAPQGYTCKDESPHDWAVETMKFIYATIGRKGAHAVAAEFGDGFPVDKAWPTLSAVDDMLSLFESSGMDGGAYWPGWVDCCTESSAMYDDQALPVVYRGLRFKYSAVQPLLAKYYTVGIVTPTPSPKPIGDVYVSDYTTKAVYKVSPGGAIKKLATGFQAPAGIAVDEAHNVYVADEGSNAIDKVAPNGSVSMVGSGFSSPFGVALDSFGNVYVADSGNNAVKKVAGDTSITTIGSGFNNPQGVAVDGNGNVYVSDTGDHAVKKVTTKGVITCVPASVPLSACGKAGFNSPAGIAVDSVGDVYVADVNANAVYEVVRGTGKLKTVGRDFSLPDSVALDYLQNLYVADSGNGSVKSVMPNGSISCVPLLLLTDCYHAGFGEPQGVALDIEGNPYERSRP